MVEAAPLPDARRTFRATLAALHRRVRAGEVGAVPELRRHLLERAWATGSAADLRYLLRVVGDAGLFDSVSLHDLLAESLRCLEAVWPAQPRPGRKRGGASDDGETRDLGALCASVESCSVSRDGGDWRPATLTDPVLRVAAHVVRNLIDDPDLQPIFLRTANAVALVCGQRSPEGQHEPARADVYRRILGRIAAALRETEVDPARDAAALVAWLAHLGMMHLSAGPRAPLEARIAALRDLAAQARPEALEELLLSEPVVEELYATRADLARVLAAWG